MNRVVCPVCKAGFEARFTRENCAINCVTCGVAFNAIAFLPKSDAPRERYTGPVLIDPPKHASTRTGGLPFPAPEINEAGGTTVTLDAPKPRKFPPEPAPLPILPKAQSLGKSILIGSAQGPAALPKGIPETNGIPIPKPDAEAKRIPQIVSPAIAEPLRAKKAGRRPLLEGSFGKYDIEGEIARGGVGAVFRARERGTGKPFALKVLIEGDDVGETERERFRHECETAKALSLPGMVYIHEVGEQDGRPYMAMELVEGKSLDRVISERSLTVNSCLVLMKSVAGTVGALHEAGYVHRDLKPGNILLDQFDTPKVADFGLVKSLDEVTRMTASGLVCGTPAYMSPEQARGEGKNVDPRSDVWALGAVLYEMLAGEPPFKADNALKLMLRITKEQPRKLSLANRKVPCEVEAIVMKCLDKNPTRRYANGRALATDIATFLEGGKPQVSTQSKVRQIFTVASANRAKIIPVIAASVAILIIGIVAHAIFSTHDASPLVEQGIQALKENPQGDEAKLKIAQRYFQDAIALDPKNGRAYLGLGATFARRGIDRKTHHVTNQKLVDDAFRANDFAAKYDPKLQTEMLATAAMYNMWLGQFEKESSLWERLVRLEPANLEFRKSLAMAYWNAGVEKRKNEYYQRAVIEFKTILSAKPNYPQVADHIKNIERNFLIQSAASTVSMAGRN